VVSAPGRVVCDDGTTCPAEKVKVGFPLHSRTFFARFQDFPGPLTSVLHDILRLLNRVDTEWVRSVKGKHKNVFQMSTVNQQKIQSVLQKCAY